MSETINYEDLISRQPPEDLTAWVLQQGALQKEYLIYRAGWEYVPLEERKRQAVEVTCTACERTFTAEKIDAGGCGRGYASAPFAWFNQLTGEGVISGSDTTCPFCGASARTEHVRAIPSGIDENICTAVISRLSVPGKKERLVISDWLTTRHIDKNGKSGFHHHLWTAWVVEERKVVRLMGYHKCMSALSYCDLEQRKTFIDDFGEYNLLYPWDPSILEGSTAANCKLDRYIESGGKYLVAYLALWLKRPAVENLLMQGCGKLVADLIEQAQYSVPFQRHKGIPKLECINWAEKKPHLMLHMSKEEFRQYGKEISANDYKLLTWARENRLEVQMPEGLALLRKIGPFLSKTIFSTVGAGDFWRVERYLDRQKNQFNTLRDYWDMAGKLDMDLQNDQVRWPKDLAVAHDRVMKRYQSHKSEILDKGFAARLEVLDKFRWSRDGILIRPCASHEELKREGKLLHHCVASYAERHAGGETAIFFIRKEMEPETPWYTLELDEKALVVRQNRGKHNCARTPEVQAFEDSWLEWIRSGCKKKTRRKKEAHVA